MPTLSALILAGGHSRRMGTDKALLMLRRSANSRRNFLGQPLLLHMVCVARQVTTDVAVVTPWPDRYRALLSTTDVRLIQEPLPDCWASDGNDQGKKPSQGPLSGFAYGWQHVTTDWCLLLACDLPYIDARSLNRWWDWIVSSVDPDLPGVGLTYSADRGLPVASLASNDKGWEPLCGFYHRSCLPSLQRQLATAQQSFQPWLRQVKIARYDDVPSQMFFNCNTPTEWQAVIDEAL